MPCWELFDAPGPGLPRHRAAAGGDGPGGGRGGLDQGWESYLGPAAAFVGMHASAPRLRPGGAEHFGFTVDNVVAAARAQLRANPAKDDTMQVGMIGLGRMGANMARRLMRRARGRRLRPDPARCRLVTDEGARRETLDAFVAALAAPRAVWMMVPAAEVDSALADLAALERGDVVIDGGNSWYGDDAARTSRRARCTTWTCGTSGGVWGLERGYSLMVGGARTPCGASPDLRDPGARVGRIRAPRARRRRPAEEGYCTAVRSAPATS